MVTSVRTALAMGLGVLLPAMLIGCAAGARPVEPLVAPAPHDAPLAGEAAAAPAPLPFRLPCANDDVAGCTAGCADHQVEDCVTLGVIKLATATGSSDADHAVSLFRAACEAGSARGCLKLGDAYHAGVLVGDADEAEAYRRACDAGANLGCVAAAGVYLAGRGVGADPAYAATLLTRVCDRGNARACFELARLYTSGEGVKTNPKRAAELFEKACKLGLDEGCLAASHSGDVLSPRD
ncbi:MAG: tetratricopeptide repeat protein [Byssovorax sp.]